MIGMTYVNALSAKLSFYPAREQGELPVIVILACDTALVGDNNDFVATLLSGSAEIKDAVHKFAVFCFVDIAMVDVNNSVTVQ